MSATRRILKSARNNVHGRYSFMIFQTDIPKFASNNQVTAEGPQFRVTGSPDSSAPFSVSSASGSGFCDMRHLDARAQA
jgi:hypothetical protein